MTLGKFILTRIWHGLVAYLVILFAFSAIMTPQLDLINRIGIPEQVVFAMRAKAESGELIGKTEAEVGQLRKEAEAALIKAYHLDEPLFQRIMIRGWNAALFKFGKSRAMSTSKAAGWSREVSAIIWEALPNTLILFGVSTVISVILALFLGIAKARYHNTSFDRVTSLLTMIFYGTPPWWMASFLIVFFAYHLQILPFGSMYSSPPPDGNFAMFIDRVYHIILPVLSVILVRFWGNAYLIKNLLLIPLEEDFVMSARGRGISESRIFYGHVLRTASPAILTMSVLTLVNSISGDLVLEKVLAWQGIGWLLWTAVQRVDFFVMMGLCTIITLFYVVCIVVLDIMYAFLDPRVRYA